MENPQKNVAENPQKTSAKKFSNSPYQENVIVSASPILLSDQIKRQVSFYIYLLGKLTSHN